MVGLQRALLLAVALLGLMWPASAFAQSDVLLWHSYRGGEADALEAVVDDFRVANPGISVRVLAVPNEAYTNKLATAIPRGNGPDVFIGAHDQTGSWVDMQLIEPFELEEDQIERFHPLTVEALRYNDALYGLPLAFKSPVLIYNKALVDDPPETTDQLFEMLEALTDADNQKYGLVYEITTFFYHSAWLHGFGGWIFNPETGQVDLANEGAAASFSFAQRIAEYLPHDVDGARVSRLFNDGDAAMVINGPWFLSSVDPSIDYGLAPLPIVSETGKHAAPFVTAEGLFLSSEARNESDALAVIRFIATDGAVTRAVDGEQMVAWLPAYEAAEMQALPARMKGQQAVFLEQLDHTVPMSNRPEMGSVWSPAEGALRKAVYGAPSGETPYWMLLGLVLLVTGVVCISRGRDPARVPDASKRNLLLGVGVACAAGAAVVVWRVLTLQGSASNVDPMTALGEAQRRYELVQAPAPAEANPAPFVAVLGLILLGLIAFGWMVWKRNKARNAEYPDNKLAAIYVAPAAVAMMLLVITPFVVGAGLSFFNYDRGEFVFVGLQNFERLFAGEGTPLTDSLSFYFTLVVTILWTVLNVFFHVGIGVGLALLLRDPLLKLRGVYRVLLIIPWAVPNYITALIWRGMFDAEFGAINGILTTIGLEPVHWFDEFLTSFSANLITNTWLGFPFMMVVTLGALQAIPRDLEDAAAVDGANRWQRFRHVTLPLLRPALVPAIVLGSIWTFNMFNIIYLVSRGNPDSSTEILISEAYKWAFERQFQYGYAAAYAIVVFLILLFYSRFTQRILDTD